MTLREFEKTCERATGLPINVIRETPLDNITEMFERRRDKRRISYEVFFQRLLEASADCDQSCSGLSLIGQSLVTHQQCEQAYQESIRTILYERVTNIYNQKNNVLPHLLMCGL